MDNQFQNNIGEEGEHPPREMLLLSVDGELASREAAQLQAHLEACWYCRVRTKKIEEAIADIIEFDEQVLKPRFTPPNNWRSFDRRLSQLAAESDNRSLLSKVFGPLGRLFSTTLLFSVPRPLVRIAAALLVAVLVAALAVRLKREPVVSAGELLKNATEAQAQQTRATTEPVVYQKLQVRRSIAQASASERLVSWEIWNDQARSRVRQSVTDDGRRRFLPAAATPEEDDKEATDFPEFLLGLGQVLLANHMDPQRPLSPDSYQAWRNSLGQKHEEVTKARLAGGVEAFTLRTVPAGPVEMGRITEAVMVVRARDWHPGELRLRVRAESGDLEYELTETAFEVVSLPALSPEIFPEQPESLVVSSPTPGVVPTAKPSPSLALNANPVPLIVPPPRAATATVELEVEVLRLLNQAGADLGEQVSAKRKDGLLRIEGIVETDARKAEILRALEPVIDDPAVRVEIKTVAEAVVEERRQSGGAARSVTERKAEITSGSMAAESELRSHFKSDDEARRFAARMVSRSQRAMRHLYALRRLSHQFSAEELNRLSTEARAKWLALVRAHARSYRQEIAGLRQELQPVFFPSAPEAAAPDEAALTDTSGVVRAIERLFELGSANDGVILSAFTISSDAATITAIKTGAFWQSLHAAEALAVRIQSAP